MSFQVTHPDKILYPEINITKSDVVEYYLSVQKFILPYIKNRLLSVLKCPQGRQKKCFFQKHLNQKNAAGLYPFKVKDSEGMQDYFYLKNKTGLEYLAQLNVLEIHPWGSQIKDIEKPDIMIFDLDPSPSVAWADVVFLAHFIKEQLEKIKLRSFVKTTGGKGLHVIIPIVPRYSWKEIKDFSKNFANTIATLQPKLCTASFSASERKGKILIDYVRNTRGATAVAPYSLRARPDAPIAMPLSWKELTPKIYANTFTIKNFKKRLSQLSTDPWKDFFNHSQILRIE